MRSKTRMRRQKFAAGVAAALVILLTSQASGRAAAATPSSGTPSFGPQQAAALDAYVTQLMHEERVPGASVAVVQNGSIVYVEGFGVRELGQRDPVTPATLMMIGSAGANLTTTMIASLVDDGTVTWDTPAVHLDPAFSVSDPSLMQKMTLKDLACACTGARNRLVEGLLAADSDAASQVASVKDLTFAGQFERTPGEADVSVSTAGALAARAAAPQTAPAERFSAQLQARVLDPIGMRDTTLSFDRVENGPDYALPHGLTAGFTYEPLALSVEQRFAAFAPAAGIWSNVDDLSRYLMTLLAGGVAPGGDRVVSSSALSATWQPVLQLASGASALGWTSDEYLGHRLLFQSGSAIGYSSELAFMPDAGIGVVVLSNAQGAFAFTSAVRYRALELAFGQRAQQDAPLKAAFDTSVQGRVARLEAASPLDVDEAKTYAGDYTSTALGHMRVAVNGNRFSVSAGVVTSDLKPLGQATYLLLDPPLAGFVLRFQGDPAGGMTAALESDDPREPGTWRFKRAARSSS